MALSKDNIGAQRPADGTASKSYTENAEKASAQPDVDRVAVVSRDANGEPRQTAGFEVIEVDDHTDEDKEAAWNVVGERTGAKAKKKDKDAK
jgi:hypothetical protein